MISQVRGTVLAAGPTWLVVEVGGIGLHLSCPPATAAAARPGSQACLQTALVVREDSLTLHGFQRGVDRDAFNLVQTASGVGPKLAMAILAVLDAERLVAALRQEDLATLCSVPGIGRKGAAKLVLELKDKVAGLEVDAPTETAPVTESWREQVAEGLEGLGWSSRDAERAVESVAGLREEDPTVSIGVLMRAALRSLAS